MRAVRIWLHTSAASCPPVVSTTNANTSVLGAGNTFSASQANRVRSSPRAKPIPAVAGPPSSSTSPSYLPPPPIASTHPAANAASPVLTTVDASVFLANPDLSEEVFGPYSILVQCDNEAQLVEVWKSIKGQISTTIMGTDNDLATNKNLLEIATTIAGRVLLNGVPTGVEVCDSMVHGGPYPASTDSRFTAVGVKAVKRWLRPISFQNWPDQLLPNYLQNKNELGVWRTVNGEFTKSDVSV